MFEKDFSEPLVSICIPVYNGEKTIEKTVYSLINQKYENIEIIIVDNCSTDSTVKTIQKIHDPRIRLFQHDVYLPISEENWNRCFEYVNGEYMAIFHADDVYSPAIISRQIEVFSSNQELGGVFTLGDRIDQNDMVISPILLPDKVKGFTPYRYDEIFPFILEYGDFLITPSVMIPTRIYKKNAPFRFEQFTTASDFDMWLRVSQSHPIMIVDEKLIFNRMSNSQYVIHHLRTKKADKFIVIDHHLSQLNTRQIDDSFPMISYELCKFKDVLFRMINLVRKKEWENLVRIIYEIEIQKVMRIILTNPLSTICVIKKYVVHSYLQHSAVNFVNF